MNTDAGWVTSFESEDGGTIVRGEGLAVSIYPDQQNNGQWTGLVRVHLAARMADIDRMADFTPQYEYSANAFRPSEIHIAEDGTLTAMHQQGATVDIRWGLSVRLPAAYLAPVRAALAAVLNRIELASSPTA